MFFLNSKIKENLLFTNKKFQSLMTGFFFFICSEWIERLCVSWLILKSTNSILATLVSFAITQIIQTIFSPFTAAAADKFGRNKIIIMVGITRFFILCFFALLVFQNKNFLILAYLASGMTGLTRSFIVPAIQGSVINSVDENQKIPAMLIYSMIMRLTGVIGSLLGGAFSIIFGIEQAILLSGFFGLIGSISLLLKSSQFKEVKNTGNYFANIKDGLKIVFGNVYTRNLLLFAGIVEIFGFSIFSLLSSITKFILDAEIGVLSILQTGISLGGFFGILGLFKWKDINKAHSIVTIIALIFGISITMITLTNNLYMAIFFLSIVGACGACFDAVQWTYLQKNVPSKLRSTAVSAWFITVGLGWTGHLFIGYMSDKISLDFSILFTGTVLIFSSFFFFIINKRNK
ncbi:MAG: MFS transporter [Chloroflexota bacterium]|nr:MFS transporter [Chloroflexota bacterium]